jgi:hypothetical protein
LLRLGLYLDNSEENPLFIAALMNKSLLNPTSDKCWFLILSYEPIWKRLKSADLKDNKGYFVKWLIIITKSLIDNSYKKP